MKKEDRYDSLFQYYGLINDINPLLLKAQAKAESAFNPNIKSRVGALGLAQFMRATWEEWKDGTPGIQASKMLFSRTNPEHSIRAQAKYMNWLFKQLKETRLVLAAYNWGIGNVKKTLRKYGFLHNIPTETQNYITKIEHFLEEYSN